MSGIYTTSIDKENLNNIIKDVNFNYFKSSSINISHTPHLNYIANTSVQVPLPCPLNNQNLFPTCAFLEEKNLTCPKFRLFQIYQIARILNQELIQCPQHVPKVRL